MLLGHPLGVRPVLPVNPHAPLLINNLKLQRLQLSNHPLGFTAAKKGAAKPHILAFPSKSVGLFGNGLIFRSDSNAEDLEGYAGAGLYDSLLFPEPEEKPIDYSEDRLTRDPDFRQELLTAISRAGVAVEKAFGSPQDIEGAWHDGQCHIVQSRPQIL